LTPEDRDALHTHLNRVEQKVHFVADLLFLAFALFVGSEALWIARDFGANDFVAAVIGFPAGIASYFGLRRQFGSSY
jgi:hypothetical protein